MQETQQPSTTEMQPSKEKRFPVVEIFGPTLQGEGPVIGMQTMFIRFGGCDYRCRRCDSLHAVLPDLIKKNATLMTAQEIFDAVKKIAGHCRMVTFSGGNPVMWDLDELVELFRNKFWHIAVETQGTLWRDWVGKCTYVTVSPKGPGMEEKFEPDKFETFLRHMTEWSTPYKMAIKVVIFDQRDIEFAKQIIHHWPAYQLFLSLGNPYPPAPATQNMSEDTISMSDALLMRMQSLWEDIRNEPLLTGARFLPQMHVLLWGNKKGV